MPTRDVTGAGTGAHAGWVTRHGAATGRRSHGHTRAQREGRARARRSLGSCLVTCQGHDRLSDGVSDIPDGVSGECREHVMKRNGEESKGKECAGIETLLSRILNWDSDSRISTVTLMPMCTALQCTVNAGESRQAKEGELSAPIRSPYCATHCVNSTGKQGSSLDMNARESRQESTGDLTGN